MELQALYGDSPKTRDVVMHKTIKITRSGNVGSTRYTEGETVHTDRWVAAVIVAAGLGELVEPELESKPAQKPAEDPAEKPAATTKPTKAKKGASK